MTESGKAARAIIAADAAVAGAALPRRNRLAARLLEGAADLGDQPTLRVLCGSMILVGAIAYAAAGVLALAQIPRSAHYPSDIAAGLVIGFAAEATVDFGLRLVEERRNFV